MRRSCEFWVKGLGLGSRSSIDGGRRGRMDAIRSRAVGTRWESIAVCVRVASNSVG